jgi:hypothetical protein
MGWIVKLLTILVISTIIVVLAIVVGRNRRFPEFRPVVTSVAIQSSDRADALYVKRMVWGLTSDHQVIVVSGSPQEEFEPDPSKEYVYKGLSPFFYSYTTDTLTVYVRQRAEVPEQLSTRIHVFQVVLGNPEMMNLMETYHEKGLQKLE